jgi:hypothetical protein
MLVLGSKGNLLLFGFVYGKCSRLPMGRGAPRVIKALAGSWIRGFRVSEKGGQE